MTLNTVMKITLLIGEGLVAVRGEIKHDTVSLEVSGDEHLNLKLQFQGSTCLETEIELRKKG